VKGLESRAWWAVFAPANLPADVTAKLREAAARIARTPAFREPLAAIGVQANTEVTDLAEFQKAEVERWQKAVRDSGAVND
jgi:tripartite-type tricarboxylate transporter receptor subunit TctC